MKLNRIIPIAIAAGIAGTASHAARIDFFAETVSPTNTPVAVEGAPVEKRQEFLNALASNVGTESFESVSQANRGDDIAISFPGTVANITATITGSEILRTDGTFDGNTTTATGRFPTSGGFYLESGDGGSFRIDFSQGISGLGFFATDLGDVGGHLELELTPTGGGDIVTIDVGNNVAGGTSGSLAFFGFIDDAQTFESVLFTNQNGQFDGFGFDDFTIADASQISPVPLPAAGLMLLTALGLGGLVRRRG